MTSLYMTFFDTITNWRWRKKQDKRKESQGGKAEHPTLRKEPRDAREGSGEKTTSDAAYGPLQISEAKKKVASFGRFQTGVLFAHHVTEKTLAGAQQNTHVFIVRKNAHARDVRNAVEARYGVNVKDVRMIILPGKERRRGAKIGWKPGLKKAIVKVKDGESLEVQ